MTKLGESRTEKKDKENRTEDKRKAEEKPVWYKTWWGRLMAIFFILSVFFLIWGGLTKPKWIKIEVSNCIIAVFTVGFTYLFLCLLRLRSRAVKFIFGLLWLLMLPNTAYLFTDLGHLPYQWTHAMSTSGRMLLLVQYLLMQLFALLTFLFSYLPFEKIIEQVNIFKKRKVIWLILFNFLVAYGMVLGRYEHINSQVVFINPLKVLRSAINIFASFELSSLTILFGFLCNFIYLLFRGLLFQRTRKYFRILD